MWARMCVRIFADMIKTRRCKDRHMDGWTGGWMGGRTERQTDHFLEKQERTGMLHLCSLHVHCAIRRKVMKSTRTRSFARLHHSVVCFLSTACVFCCAHLLAHSLTHPLWGSWERDFLSTNQTPGFCTVSNHNALLHLAHFRPYS